jgi:hypothetical protein
MIAIPISRGRRKDVATVLNSAYAEFLEDHPPSRVTEAMCSM